ncbi:MAG: MFS transporter [Verrucomicrobiales bacterium]
MPSSDPHIPAPTERPPASRGVLGVIFLTVFLDLVGFGILIPLLPLYAESLGASGLVVGGIMAIYSFMQFLFSPIWGRWSDRIGRRPLMLFGTAGASVAYTIFALGAGFQGSTALAIFFAARMLAGFCGANLAVAQAAIADVTPPELRSKRMALIGIAFGLGFIFGPAIGGLSLKHFGLAGPGWVACGLCAINFVAAFFLLPETRRPGAEAVKPRPRLEQWFATLRHPQIGTLVLVFFLSTFAFACFETTLGLLVSKNFNLDFKGKDAGTIAGLFVFCGVIGVLAQGGLIGRLLKVFGEGKLIALSLVLAGAALGPLPFLQSWLPLYLALAVLSLGSSLTRPPVFGLISKLAHADEQGATLGVAQSAGSLARIAGPLFASFLFFQNPTWPYLACSALCLITAGVVMMLLLPRLRRGENPT